ncbi:6615_t:CDS:2 [Paraglomus occultum]|uniref:Defect at low temperature protein 1 n=1 Tax=Paraglomus occultum TaxID=144539 RepID=A0A9N8VUQ4_9GLOM|nr:6615_t:CDS:2 [Paraglomus occultum]
MLLMKILYTTSFIFFALITVAALFLSAADVILEAWKDETKRIEYLTIIAVAYLLLGFLAVTIGLSRLFTTRKTLNNIPKSYVPIREEDIPRSVHSYITKSLADICCIALASQPSQDTTQPGWGRPGTSLANIHFKTSIRQTAVIIEQAVQKSTSIVRHPSMTIQRYIDYLVECRLIDKRIGRLYVEGYEKARFSEEETGEEHYKEFMRLVAVLLRMIRKNEVYYKSEIKEDESNLEVR